MKRADLKDFILENGLLADVSARAGIYVIAIDYKVVYVGQSKDMYERCSGHIYKIQNAVLVGEKKYELLLSAQLGGHMVDCYSIEFCDIENLKEREKYWIERLKPCLNIDIPGGHRQDISNLKIEDVLSAPCATVE